MLNHETITKYKSSFLLLCHSDSPATLFSFSCSPPYTNTALINCGTGNYIEATGKFHFNLHLDYRIFHSYQSAVQDQCVDALAHMQTQLFMAFLYSHWCKYGHTHTNKHEVRYAHTQIYIYTNCASTWKSTHTRR